MKFVFFGNADSSVIVFEKLVEAGYVPAAVVCGPDRPVGRKQILTPSPLKIAAQKYGMLIFQPESLKTQRSGPSNIFFQEWDFFIVAAYPKIIPQEILDIPKLGTIGVHPSLLPRHRGASPIQTAILVGDRETGVTLYLMDGKMDHGSIFAGRKLQLEIHNLQLTALSNKLWELGGDLLVETLPEFLTGKITPIIQDESKATYTKKFKTEDAYIEPLDLDRAQKEGGEIAVEIERKIRAFNPEPGAWTVLHGKRAKILEASLYVEKLKITKIQKDGKKPISLV